MTKQSKKKMFWLFVLVGLPLAVVMRKNRINGTWNGSPWNKVVENYPGISVSVFSNKVTVTSRPDLSGELIGDKIIWNKGTPTESSWTRTR